MKWRKINNVLHRDLGYLCVGLTIIYAVSGVAVNHIEDWNPSYSIEVTEFRIQDAEEKDEKEMVEAALSRLEEEVEIESSFRPSPNHLQLFYSGNTIDINFESGNVRLERVKKRPLLFDFNFLHLNHAKKLWTWVADLYALALFLLAITGLFVLPGRKGIKGRGAWMTAIGILIPVIFLIIYGYF